MNRPLRSTVRISHVIGVSELRTLVVRFIPVSYSPTCPPNTCCSFYCSGQLQSDLSSEHLLFVLLFWSVTVSLDCIRLYTHCMCLLCRQCSQEVQSCVELGSLYGLYAFFQIILRDRLRLPNDPSESAK